MPRRTITTVAWAAAGIGAAFWSIFALVAYFTVDVIGSGMANYGTVPGFPAEPFTFPWIAARLHGAGLATVFGGWLIGLALLFGGAWLVHRLFGGRRTAPPPGRQSWGSSIPSAPVSSVPAGDAARSDRLRR